MQTPNHQAILLIRTYFDGERSEQLLLLGFCGLLLVASLTLMWRGDPYLRGLAVGFLLTFALFTSACIPILIRDKANVERLAANPRIEALVIERERITKVVSNYPLYRYAFLAVAAFALIALMLRPSDFLTGLGAGLLILAFTGFVVDHFSERRAKIYAAGLHGMIGISDSG